ncbi:cyclic AMP-responsive element-binding protein 3-like protein 3-B [Saccoglossus kowalevskii]|uniref:Cyclic AMP-responsive element-binding protein 3-like protein 4-like n=1 Tax=Saccoglossus kowalevskii TaxID=10224 RepID=A0ABM0GNA6_SACKO|nr:PREDICTED: cyclic AMP-responsive element-binding protein 3-like protein 4-like [Saccoglossus kowalevskii]
MAVDIENADVLDMLFDGDGILLDDAFIGRSVNTTNQAVTNFNSDNMQEVTEIGKAKDTHDLFSSLLQMEDQDVMLSGPPTPSPQYCVASPLNSDSGISDDNPGTSECSPLSMENIEMISHYDTDQTSAILITREEDMVTTTALPEDNFSFADFADDFRLSDSPTNKETLPFTLQDLNRQNVELINDSVSCKRYPELILTEEEKRLLSDMNTVLPVDMPLTKEEERTLKAVRRKIRNKQSAQDSRKRKKEYVDGLEHRVSACTKQNIELQRKVERLEKQNVTLVEQLKRLQALITKTSNKTTQTSTCVMVLLLSFALLVVPSYNPFKSSSTGPTPPTYSPSGVVMRTLKEDGSQPVTETMMVGGDPYSYTKSPEGEWKAEQPKSVVEMIQDISVDETIQDIHRKNSSARNVPVENGGGVVMNEAVPIADENLRVEGMINTPDGVVKINGGDVSVTSKKKNNVHPPIKQHPAINDEM